jgi:DNA polymerase-3 subunit chi
MTRIDFYILPAPNKEDRYAFACKLIEKAYHLGHRILIHADSEAEAKALDELLWSYRESAFLPHAMLDPENPTRPSVEIHWNEDCADHDDLLVNLSNHLPEHFSRFQRVAEVVVQDEAVLKSTRYNYKFYQDRNYPLNRHDMRKHPSQRQ